MVTINKSGPIAESMCKIMLEQKSAHRRDVVFYLVRTQLGSEIVVNGGGWVRQNARWYCHSSAYCILDGLLRPAQVWLLRSARPATMCFANRSVRL
jgi:hypothetical protein